MTDVTIHRGLKDIYLDRTKSSYIDGKNGKLYYRGFNINELANNSTFEEVSYLLIHGELPNKSELAEITNWMACAREIPSEIITLIDSIKHLHPMDMLRTIISALAAFDNNLADESMDANIERGLSITAKAPSIVAAHVRLRNGDKYISPNPNLSHAANFLYMLNGREPDLLDAKLIDKDLILHAEHGLNASSFTARVVASTQSDMYSALTAGIAALKGPAHGGAAEGVMKQAQDIGDESNTVEYVKNLLSSGGRIMGFGHRVYKTADPRALILKVDAKSLSERKGNPRWFAILQSLAECMKPYEKKGICENVDFWTGAIYNLLEIPDDIFVSIFALARIPGWTAQVAEQLNNNILIRPLLDYVGELDKPYIPIEERK
jgi:citrate synthase